MCGALRVMHGVLFLWTELSEMRGVEEFNYEKATQTKDEFTDVC